MIGLDEGALQRASLVAYVWPLSGLLAGSILGQLWLGTADTELAAILAGLSGLLAGVVVARRQSTRMAADRRYRARILLLLGSVATVPMVLTNQERLAE